MSTRDTMEYDMRLTEAEINTILQGLYELPTKLALPIIQKINGQVVPQMPKQEPKE